MLETHTQLSDTKPTNPKDALGSDRLPVHLWPMSATAFGCIGLLNGAGKYGRANWREAGIRPSIYIDAAIRHLTDWFEGNDTDPADGVHNLAGALASIAIVVDAMCSGKLVDDRNYNGIGWRKAREMMEPHVARLKALHAGKTPKHYTISDGAPKNIGVDVDLPAGKRPFWSGYALTESGLRVLAQLESAKNSVAHAQQEAAR
jgi:hypothetical protein